MRRILFLLALPITLALSVVGVIANSVPALAAGSICETSGSFCIGATSLSSGNAVIEVNPPGRTMTWQSSGTMYTAPDGHQYPNGILKFTGATNSCAVGNQQVGFEQFVQTGPCSGVNGVNWALYNTGGGSGDYKYMNTHYSNSVNQDSMISGLNQHNNQFTIRVLGANGYLQRFNLN